MKGASMDWRHNAPDGDGRRYISRGVLEITRTIYGTVEQTIRAGPFGLSIICREDGEVWKPPISGYELDNLAKTGFVALFGRQDGPELYAKWRGKNDG